MRVRLLAGTALVSMGALPTAVLAQDTAPQATDRSVTSGEIIVTARKKEEQLIDVPLAITAIGEAEIQASGIENVSDLSRQVPGFSFKQGFGRTGSGDGGASVRPSIRGMSNILGTPNAGFFVDGIFVSQNITSYQLDNLERVEVIRGPQSALFGRQTFSGAINFVTRKPGNELRGAINATAGQWGHGEVSGYIQVPLVEDRLAIELNGRVYHFGGDYVNQDNGKRDINAQDSQNFGARLRWTPSSNLEVLIGGAVGHDRDKGYSSFIVPSTALNCFLPNIVGTIAGIPRSSTRSRGYFCGEIKTPDTFAYNNAEIEALGYHPLERSYLRADATIEYTTESDWTLTAVGAFNWQENQNGFDNTYLPSTNPSLSIGYRSNRDHSLEARIQTPQSWRVRGLFGGYYYQADDDEQYTVNTTTTSANYRLRSNAFSDDAVRNLALFGLIEADVTDRLTLSAEGRYEVDRITGSQENEVLLGYGQPTNIRSKTYKIFLPRVTARYELAPNWNLYGSVAKGNKPGGFNDYPSDARAASIADFDSRNLGAFDEESVWSYELGTKGRIGGVNFNVAAYHLDWSQQQLTLSYPYQRTQGDFRTTPFIVNAGQSRVNGFEVELFGALSDWFDFRVAYAYNDAKFVDFYDENTEQIYDTDGRPSFLDPEQTQVNPADVDGPDGQVKGNRLPQTPVHQLAVNGNVKFPVSNTAAFFIRSDFTYDTKRYVQVHNLAHTGDSLNVNLRTGVELDNKLTLTLFVNNLTDDRSPVVGTRLFEFSRTLLVPDPLRVTFGQPVLLSFYRNFLVSAPRRRQIGVSANYKF
ncbi:Pesticin receptor precursor [Tsuneonella dongtanensis]|uniref:Pesticin receptor n=1 Tax=Tsuneonella dongtanensis TaxID=692370 RepID=A0A1B2AG11_9SPHN|nr:TonB-dependent receptor [Tsuneonella dongtanensis]ANY21082.1 Pesticin receptor precursor [Tsuneonella dongtanensis]